MTEQNRDLYLVSPKVTQDKINAKYVIGGPTGNYNILLLSPSRPQDIVFLPPYKDG